MTTLIKSGDRVCNASCHYARFSTCRCVCGGRYHGCGRDGTLIEKVHETQDRFVEWLEGEGCDVSELKNAKKGALAEKLEAERQAWLARRRAPRTRRSRSEGRKRRTVSERQGRFDFSARDAIVVGAEEALYNHTGEEISGRQDGLAPERGR